MSLASKLLKFQKETGAVIKGSVNPHFMSKYADINAVLDVVKGPLNDLGIVISQGPGADIHGKYLETVLIDTDTGDNQEQQMSLSSKFYFAGTEDTVQKISTAITYARRVSLIGMLGLEQEDDDGETASGRGAAKPASAKVAPTATLTKEGTVTKIGQYARVAIEKKLTTQDDFARMLVDTYQVDETKKLTEAQASTLLANLQKLVEGKK